jgi:hypothetical protein
LGKERVRQRIERMRLDGFIPVAIEGQSLLEMDQKIPMIDMVTVE